MSLNKKAAKEYSDKYADTKDIRKKQDFIKEYIQASNAATGSKFDSNANVSNKNIVTLGQELYKENNIKQNRYILCDKIRKMFSKKLAEQYIKDLESHVLYKHDESGTPGYPYCVAITMYPFLTDGLTKLGGVSRAPTDLKSYCGEFINLVYSVSSQFMGAVATPEFLMYMDYFIRKDYGEDYLTRLDEVVDCTAKKRTLTKVIDNCFQQVVHSMNMPAGNRG
jgi:ribonucleoside-triphosphate reductase